MASMGNTSLRPTWRMRPDALSRFHHTGNANPMGADQKSHILMGQGKLNLIAFLFLLPVLFGHIEQNLIEALFQMGMGHGPQPIGQMRDAAAQIFDDLKADMGALKNQFFEIPAVQRKFWLS